MAVAQILAGWLTIAGTHCPWVATAVESVVKTLSHEGWRTRPTLVVTSSKGGKGGKNNGALPQPRIGDDMVSM